MTGREEDARRAQEDAEWLRLVESYGDRPEFPEPPAATPVAEEAAVEDAEHGGPLFDGPAELNPTWEDEGGFVPPPAPPVPRPRGVKAVAWFGLFGVPMLVLASIMIRLELSSSVLLFLLAWFVGGFGYLIVTMKGPPDSGSGWDDGAVV